MNQIVEQYITSSMAAKILGIKQITVSQMCQQGRLTATKLANRWLLPRTAVEDFAKTYVPRVGRPRQKRQYTKRSERWFKKK